jgi:DNA-binding CsgD family transcriptional regulator
MTETAPTRPQALNELATKYANYGSVYPTLRKLLADGEWHPYSPLRGELDKLIPPEHAWRFRARALGYDPKKGPPRKIEHGAALMDGRRRLANKWLRDFVRQGFAVQEIRGEQPYLKLRRVPSMSDEAIVVQSQDRAITERGDPVPDNPLLTAALKYAAHGWPVFPCEPRGKRPLTTNGLKDATTDPDVIRAWWKQWPAANVGYALPESKIVIDPDGDEGEQSLAAREKQHGALPETLEQKTGRGRQLFFEGGPNHDIRNSAGKLGPGLDVRARGGYVILPPSVHLSGAVYAWTRKVKPAVLTAAWQALLARPPAPPPAGNADGDVIPEGRRNSALASLGGKMRRAGMTQAAIEAALLEENTLRCKPPLPEDEVRRTAASIATYPAGKAAVDASHELVALSIEEFMAHEFPPREPILSPWLVRQTLAMIYAWRGVGKTYCGLEIAYAVATGGEFLGWTAPTARKVLYIDGEMTGALMQKRLASIITASEKSPVPGMLRIINPDLQRSYMPDLATVGGQAAIESKLEPDTDLIIVDSISSLIRRGGRENEAESWLAAAEWAVWKRSQGHSILFIHHAGKDGEQRGTSKREDLLEVSICLRRPANYNPKDGAVFEVYFKKGRDIFGNDVDPFEASLTASEDGRRVWTTKPVSVTTSERVAELAKLGLSDKEIADELGVNRSTVYRAKLKAQADPDGAEE